MLVIEFTKVAFCNVFDGTGLGIGTSYSVGIRVPFDRPVAKTLVDSFSNHLKFSICSKRVILAHFCLISFCKKIVK